MAGVEIQANLISQIISAVLDNRPLIQTLSEPIEYLWILLWWGVGTTIAILMPQSAKFWRSLLLTTGGIVIAATAIMGITYASFLESWWLPVVPPIMALVGSPLMIVTAQAYKGIKIRQTFGRYLSDDVVKVLLEDPEGLQLGGETRRITILVSDIRGFSLLASRIPAEVVVKILNLYLETMTEIIFKYGGTIDEFLGDGILAIFGAPLIQEDHAEKAVATAIAMQQAIKSVNDRIATLKDLPDISLEMGISINTGEVVIGNIGSKARSKYGVVGHQATYYYLFSSGNSGKI
ncbi:MAG: adenylate/guanylate cyclase domain-containing protein [Xenococcaceae cyanobacterium MO_188.B19]|nr:adenylate/guanylate cyclase domain-containing protein [Xenococcaceae cyanobacterium MO_188.B19]